MITKPLRPSLPLTSDSASNRRDRSYILDMAETSEQIKRHIANLTEFETKFGEFVAVLNHEVVAGEKRWSKEEMARRKREISALAAKADRAMKASGVGQLAIYNPPAIGGGLKSGDLPSQVFDFVQFGYDDDGLTFQREILERIPAQLAGLEMRLEEAEEAEKESGNRLFGELVQGGIDRARKEREALAVAPSPDPEPATKAPPEPKPPWHEHPIFVPMLIGIIATVVGGLILAAILGLFG